MCLCAVGVGVGQRPVEHGEGESRIGGRQTPGGPREQVVEVVLGDHRSPRPSNVPRKEQWVAAPSNPATPVGPCCGPVCFWNIPWLRGPSATCQLRAGGDCVRSLYCIFEGKQSPARLCYFLGKGDRALVTCPSILGTGGPLLSGSQGPRHPWQLRRQRPAHLSWGGTLPRVTGDLPPGTGHRMCLFPAQVPSAVSGDETSHLTR